MNDYRSQISNAPARPPVIILGGGANALSVGRSLGRLGVKVLELPQVGAFSRYSRFSRALRAPAAPGGEADEWADALLGAGASALHGSVVLACCDAGLELLCDRRDELLQHYLLDDSNVFAQRQMLNKWETYRAAAAAGTPTPKFWFARSIAELEKHRQSLVFPLIVKPKASHIFESYSGKKLLVVDTFDELGAAMKCVSASGTEAMLVEMIPGPDDRLCSYYTYLDEHSRPTLHFTKRIIRRYPALRGTGCYHITDWNPRAAELGNRLFAHIGLRGLANVEFKRDERDGELKLIECNARFTAADCLVARSGVNLAAIVYAKIIGCPVRLPTTYRTGLRLWDPVRDFCSYRELRTRDGLSAGRWLSSVLHRQTFAYFNWSDPLPALARLMAPIARRLRRRPEASPAIVADPTRPAHQGQLI